MEEFRAADEDREEGAKSWKRVQNVETGEVFRSVLAAERTMGVAANNIRTVLNKPNRTSRGYHSFPRKSACRKPFPWSCPGRWNPA